ncbi:hypothetical protein MY5147_009135 [Beauveria neobassiana]
MKAAVTILLTAALGRAMPQAADEPKLPWVPQPTKKCVETWRSMLALSTLQEAEQKCGTVDVCHTFDYYGSRDLLPQIVRKFGFKDEAECLAAHEGPPRSPCNQVLDRLYDYSSTTPLSREEVDQVCGEGYFCETFDPEDLEAEDIEFFTRVYSYKNVKECLDAHDSNPATANNAFSLKTRYTTSCGGKVNNDVTISEGSNGQCIDTSCDVGSLDIAAEGTCPDGQVRISYWQNKGCSGDWYGYGYGSRGTCRGLWSDGWNFQSLYVSCAKQADDCVTKGQCTPAPSPQQGVCRANDDVAFHVKTRYKTDCTGTTHDDVAVVGGAGRCINTDCAVGSLDISDAGNCPDGEIRISYWEQANCGDDGGRWFGYGYASRDMCRTLWSGGWNFKSLYVSCAKKIDDCVTKGQCSIDSVPDTPIC